MKNAPRVEADGELSADEERQLYEHDGSSDYGDWQGEGQPRGRARSGGRAPAARDHRGGPSAAHVDGLAQGLEHAVQVRRRLLDVVVLVLCRA